MDTDYLIQLVTDGCDPDVIVEVLDLPVDQLVEALRSQIIDNESNFLDYLEIDDE
jgi:hypothetical protein